MTRGHHEKAFFSINATFHLTLNPVPYIWLIVMEIGTTMKVDFGFLYPWKIRFCTSSYSFYGLFGKLLAISSKTVAFLMLFAQQVSILDQAFAKKTLSDLLGWDKQTMSLQNVYSGSSIHIINRLSCMQASCKELLHRATV